MKQLPIEVLYTLCSFLDPEDVGGFRLACRDFAHIGARFCFDNIVVFLHERDFRQLRSVAERYPSCVRSLTYHAPILKAGLTFAAFRDAIVDNHTQFGTRKRRVAPSRDVSYLEAEYARYEAALQSQERLLQSQDDFKCFDEVCARLTNLKSITLSADECFFEDVPMVKTPFDDLMSIFKEDVGKHVDFRQLEVLLSGLRLSKSQPSLLRAGVLPWHIFSKDENRLREYALPLSHVRHLELVIDPPFGYDQDSILGQLQKHALTAAQGQNFLEYMSKLEILDVEFTMKSGFEVPGVAMMSLALPQDHKWQYLRELRLGNVKCERQDIMAICNLHKETLRELCLCEVHLSSTSWMVLLPEIRESLDLTHACICGTIYGTREDGIPGPESWSFSPTTPAGIALWDAVNEYCCGLDSSTGEPECPLHD
ncbi:hypothetical protein BX600DRAFT_455799 [Xylariales sp. PMI_506]|nr:hypothetical protein BX600DRAFT_455799 [Xylariales sp. PMI_506]